jgi:hypothetical protein
MPSFYMGLQLIDLKGCCIHDNPTCTTARVIINFLPATTFYDAKRHSAYFILLNNIFMQYFFILCSPCFCVRYLSLILNFRNFFYF